MPAASAAYPTSRGRASARSAPRDRRAGLRGTARVRWDRLGRIAMLLVLVALVFLYVDTGVRMLSTWRQAHHSSARVAAMEREHRALLGENTRLSSQANLEAQAKALGMQQPDEQTYVVGNLPNN